jgi:hypothetical protein
MASKSHKRHHWVPKCYLGAWADQNTPVGFTPYVHVFPKEGGESMRRAPAKLFRETDLYTISLPDGRRDLRLEKGLSGLEKDFTEIRKEFLEKRKELPFPRLLKLLAFVAVSHVRTPFNGSKSHYPEAERSQKLYNETGHAIMQESPRLRAKNTRAQTPALLKGIIFTETGTAMTPTATKKGSRLYRYYASMDLIRNRPIDESGGPLRLPAGMVEDAVIGEIRRMIRAPEIAAKVLKMLREESPTVDEKATIKALGEFDQIWTALYPAEQTRIIQLLIDRVTVGTSGIAVDLRQEGLGSVLRDMMAPRPKEACA